MTELNSRMERAGKEIPGTPVQDTGRILSSLALDAVAEVLPWMAKISSSTDRDRKALSLFNGR